jgi:hypothetical protein
MSCSSSLRTADPGGLTRRAACRTLLGAPLLGVAAWAPGQVAAATPAAPVGVPATWLRRGSGEYRRFGLLIYEATLWADERNGVTADTVRPPLALQLTYRRGLSGAVIAQASVGQMRRFVTDEARLTRWSERLARLFPDVEPGDRLLGVHSGQEARFFHNDRAIGAVDDSDFATAFFAIWLDARTSAPALRASLLQRTAG